jgi:hypothetical protein
MFLALRLIQPTAVKETSMGKTRFGFLFYLALISLFIVALVYYQGLTSDVATVAPVAIQLGALAQGRNPYTGAFSNYPGTAKAA